jgi:hypothetical protein
MEKRKTLLIGAAVGTAIIAAAIVIATTLVFQSVSETSAVDNSVC